MPTNYFFTVVENTDKDTFCRQVSALLEDKWELHGPSSFISDQDAEGNAMVGVYIQALLKKVVTRSVPIVD